MHLLKTCIKNYFIKEDFNLFISRPAIIDSRKSSPFELGLGWTVKLKKRDFIGKKALNIPIFTF